MFQQADRLLENVDLFTLHLFFVCVRARVCVCVSVSALCPSVGSLETSSKECWVINTAEILKRPKNIAGERVVFFVLSFLRVSVCVCVCVCLQYVAIETTVML